MFLLRIAEDKRDDDKIEGNWPWKTVLTAFVILGDKQFLIENQNLYLSHVW